MIKILQRIYGLFDLPGNQPPFPINKFLLIPAKVVIFFPTVFHNFILTNLSQSQQQTQATDIQEEEIKLPYVKDTTERLRCILRSHEVIRPTYCTETTLCKLLCKTKDRVATEDKNNIVYEIDCNNCEAVYFSESKRSLK